MQREGDGWVVRYGLSTGWQNVEAITSQRCGPCTCDYVMAKHLHAEQREWLSTHLSRE